MNDKKGLYGQMEELFQFILKQVDGTKVSKSNKQLVKDEIKSLQSFVVGARPARIAIVGRRGAGKSSLINAIFGEQRAKIGDYKSQTGMGKWYLFENELGGIEILDTRGLGESHSPEETIARENPKEEVILSIKEKCPDVILFLSKGKEVGARIDEDLEQLLEIKQSVLANHNYDVPIVGIVTQVDELAPISNSTPPFDHPKKQENIQATVDLLREKIEAVIVSPVNVIPISAYMEFENGQIDYDVRWNIDVLLDYLLTELPNEAQVIIAKLSKITSVQKNLARKLSRSMIGVTGIVAATPIPIADTPVITGLQLSMIGTIAMIGGKKMNRKTIVEFIATMGVNIGVGMTLREVSRQLVKIFPGAGSVISASIASAGTYALSEAAIAYFIENKSEAEAKKVYEREFAKEKLENGQKER